MAKGKLFVIDGTDGSGKATQVGLLISRLMQDGHEVFTVAFPRYGNRTAGPVEAYLAGEFGGTNDVGPKQGSILYAVDRFGAKKEIEEALEAGDIVVLDRYVLANMGHQGAKIADPEERKAFFRWNDELEHGTFGIPRPDLNIILHVPTDIAMRLADGRERKKDIHERDPDHLRAAERTYLEIAETYPNCTLIECAKEGSILSREEIHERVYAAVLPLLKG